MSTRPFRNCDMQQNVEVMWWLAFPHSKDDRVQGWRERKESPESSCTHILNAAQMSILVNGQVVMALGHTRRCCDMQQKLDVIQSWGGCKAGLRRPNRKDGWLHTLFSFRKLLVYAKTVDQIWPERRRSARQSRRIKFPGASHVTYKPLTVDAEGNCFVTSRWLCATHS